MNEKFISFITKLQTFKAYKKGYLKMWLTAILVFASKNDTNNFRNTSTVHFHCITYLKSRRSNNICVHIGVM
jgi:hypothetical protein